MYYIVIVIVQVQNKIQKGKFNTVPYVTIISFQEMTQKYEPKTLDFLHKEEVLNRSKYVLILFIKS